MTKPDVVLARLLLLRRLTERRALDEQFARHEDCRRAQREVDEAADTATRRLADARAHEQQQIGSLIGQAVSQSSMLRFQEKVDGMLADHQQMRTVEQNARTALGDSVAALADARAKFQMRQRATAKLDLVAKQRSVRTARRQAALAETGQEEHALRGPTFNAFDGSKA
jgi:hypothetical protein